MNLIIGGAEIGENEVNLLAWIMFKSHKKFLFFKLL